MDYCDQCSIVSRGVVAVVTNTNASHAHLIVHVLFLDSKLYFAIAAT